MGRNLLKIKKWSQITIPVEIRTEFNLSEGDYLEVEQVEEGILLRPVVFQQKEVVVQEDVLSEEEWLKLQAEIEEGAKYWAERDKQITQEWLPLEEELWRRQ
ncbi:MAG: AbrB/MazE/SpoVT family DNA-binding domain-containing protein [Blastocatellia bacterium]|nr:AbrB/MazE/SpoVT family DNA-binding domain-containing protein [Blastocatellia bacterium]